MYLYFYKKNDNDLASIMCLTHPFFFQVAVLDWNKETGLKTVNEFAEIFGDDSVHFIECDVSRKIDMESGSCVAFAISL